MPRQQRLHNGLARPVDSSILHRIELARLQPSPCWHSNRRDSVLAYGQRGWLTAI